MQKRGKKKRMSGTADILLGWGGADGAAAIGRSIAEGVTNVRAKP
jgi:hypothetical protein